MKSKKDRWVPIKYLDMQSGKYIPLPYELNAKGCVRDVNTKEVIREGNTFEPYVTLLDGSRKEYVFDMRKLIYNNYVHGVHRNSTVLVKDTSKPITADNLRMSKILQLNRSNLSIVKSWNTEEDIYRYKQSYPKIVTSTLDDMRLVGGYYWVYYDDYDSFAFDKLASTVSSKVRWRKVVYYDKETGKTVSAENYIVSTTGKVMNTVTMQEIVANQRGTVKLEIRDKCTVNLSVKRILVNTFIRKLDPTEDVIVKDSSKGMRIDNLVGSKIVQCTKEGVKVKIWDSASAAISEGYLHASSILDVCRGKKSTYKGYVWYFLDDILQKRV